jgi:hypothetical protein
MVMDDQQSAKFLQELEAAEAAFNQQKTERRTSERHAYSRIQMVAPCSAYGPPVENTFRPAYCHDISRGGFSFLWPALPDFDHVVVRLAGGPRFILVKARVVHSGPIADLSNRFLVRCEFVERFQ